MERQLNQRERRQLCDEIRANTRLLVSHVDFDSEGRVYRTKSLMHQLREAVANGREANGPQRGKSRPLPISVAAHDLLVSIETVSRQWSTVNGLTEYRIWCTTNWICGSKGDVILKAWAEHVAKWVKQIMELFDPPKCYHISAPCPECGATSTRMYNKDYREYVRVPALQILNAEYGKICRCINCGTEWTEERFLLLARAIGVGDG